MKIDRREAEDRVATIDDEKKRALDLWDMRLVPPSVGIFDDPVRCYKINKEWAAVVMGMVSWLADIPAWRDAQHEGYSAIEQILQFMVGVECDLTDYRLRQKPTDNCVLQQSVDAGATWTDVFDFSLCVTIQDNTQQVLIQNQVTYVQPTFQEIYNNYVSNYSGTPESVHPDLAEPTGDTSALRAAYCNAVWQLVDTACNAAISYYTESIDSTQNEINVGLGIAAFMLAAISVAGAIPTAGASLAGLAPAAGLWAAGVGLGSVLGNQLVDFWQQHTIDQFEDVEAKEAVTCFIIASCQAADNSLDCMRNAFNGTTGDPNGQAILDFLSIMFENEATYAAFLEKWNNNKQYADAGIELYCPCESGYKVWVWDFSNGLGNFDLILGTLVGGRIKAVVAPTNPDLKVIELTLPQQTTWRITAMKQYTERINGSANGSFDTVTQRLRPTAGTNSGSFFMGVGGFRPNGIDIACQKNNVAPLYWSGGVEIYILDLLANADDDGDLYLDRIEIQYYEDYAPSTGYITDDDNICV